MAIILFLIIFGVVVISHEFGHYLIARVNGIHVVEFSVGMGPTIAGFTKGDTKYSLKLLPIGGACMFEGEDGLNQNEGGDSSGSFQSANVWSRIATVAAGPLFNLALAFIVAFVMVQMIWIRDPYIEEIVENSAAQEAGLMPGDTIVSLNGRKIYLYEEISYYNQLSKGEETLVVYRRNGEICETVLTPRLDEATGRYMLGVSNGTPFKVSGMASFKYAWYEVRASLINTYKSLILMVRGRVSRKEVSGPVGIADTIGDIYEETKESVADVFVNMLNFILLLSVNLGVLNLMPLPALDGGRLVFLFLEVLRGKPIEPQKEGLVHFIGLMFFMLLMVLVLFNDIANIFAK